MQSHSTELNNKTFTLLKEFSSLIDLIFSEPHIYFSPVNTDSTFKINIDSVVEFQKEKSSFKITLPLKDIGLLQFDLDSTDKNISILKKLITQIEQEIESAEIKKRSGYLLETAESRFKTIFEQSPLSIQICSNDGRTLLVNPAWKRLWNIGQELIDNYILTEYNMLEDVHLEAQGVLEYIKKGFNGEVSQVPIIKYDPKELKLGGTEKSVEGLIFPLKNAAGKVKEVVLIHIDVSEKEKLLADLKLERNQFACMAIENEMLYKQSQEAIAQRDEFISIASHELKTPITSMKLQIQAAEKITLKEDTEFVKASLVKKMTQSSIKQLNRITNLVEDMLDISRISANKLTINSQENNLSELVNEVLSRFQPQLEVLSITLHTAIQENIFTSCDAFRFEQVLNNLLTNAIRYGETKPITVNLSLKDDQVILEVKDEGLGIDPTDQERIFNRFERAISSNNISGLGLGLFISKEIMSRHGGSLSVSSTLGLGSIFRAVLPLK